ncbi:hypothetical protein QFZ36_000778 [Pseudarthrobacter siccitolerans]|uniref:Uncharacterized protein n=1 Tax=Pseudarthrobacter siccitolerans TaxID=861266 RepID=A0ABU0PI17_9MICC|nr:hypothetical protein [Pseudarthrobacter siccitolerans]
MVTSRNSAAGSSSVQSSSMEVPATRYGYGRTPYGAVTVPTFAARTVLRSPFAVTL